MIYLLLSITASTCIFVVFKLFDRLRIHTIQAIIVNYITASLCGFLAVGDPVATQVLVGKPWFYLALILGSVFIVVFYLMAITTQKGGLSVVSVATKMSLVIPVLFGIFYYNETLGLFKGLGIVLALLAVYFVSVRKRGDIRLKRSFIVYPLLVFIGSGFIDTSIKYLEDSYVNGQDVAIFSATIFGGASLVGLFVLLYLAIRGRLKIQMKNIIGGICLGIPNFFSIYFIVRALRTDILDTSGIFTVNNVAIVMTSTLVGILAFKERLSTKNWIGIVMAIVSIITITIIAR